VYGWSSFLYTVPMLLLCAVMLALLAACYRVASYALPSLLLSQLHRSAHGTHACVGAIMHSWLSVCSSIHAAYKHIHY